MGVVRAQSTPSSVVEKSTNETKRNTKMIRIVLSRQNARLESINIIAFEVRTHRNATVTKSAIVSDGRKTLFSPIYFKTLSRGSGTIYPPRYYQLPHIPRRHADQNNNLAYEMIRSKQTKTLVVVVVLR